MGFQVKLAKHGFAQGKRALQGSFQLDALEIGGNLEPEVREGTEREATDLKQQRGLGLGVEEQTKREGRRGLQQGQFVPSFSGGHEELTGREAGGVCLELIP
jgi:hypothetical protein